MRVNLLKSSFLLIFPFLAWTSLAYAIDTSTSNFYANPVNPAQTYVLAMGQGLNTLSSNTPTLVGTTHDQCPNGTNAWVSVSIESTPIAGGGSGNSSCPILGMPAANGYPGYVQAPNGNTGGYNVYVNSSIQVGGSCGNMAPLAFTWTVYCSNPAS